MTVEQIARQLCRRDGGEMIVAVVDCGAKLFPVCRDPVSIGIAVVALLQTMVEHPAFVRDRALVDQFLADFDVGRFRDVKVSGPEDL